MSSSMGLRAVWAVHSLFLLSAIASAQNSSPGPQGQSGVYQSPTTLRANTRLVVVDVVVTDNKGQPVTDLKAEDFTMLEEGKPQKISNFSFQHPGVVPAPAARPLPPNVVTNAPQFATNSLNVILFDGVNGEFASQAYARDQLIKFFAGASLDRPVANLRPGNPNEAPARLHHRRGRPEGRG